MLSLELPRLENILSPSTGLMGEVGEVGERGEREPRSKEELGDLAGGSPGETGDDGEGGGSLRKCWHWEVEHCETQGLAHKSK